jgi:hypothetical protein
MLAATTSVKETSAIGICAGHTRQPKDERLIIQCPTCEPVLRTNKATWGDVADPPKTVDEDKAAKRAERDAINQSATQLAAALASVSTAAPAATASSSSHSSSTRPRKS